MTLFAHHFLLLSLFYSSLFTSFGLLLTLCSSLFTPLSPYFSLSLLSLYTHRIPFFIPISSFLSLSLFLYSSLSIYPSLYISLSLLSLYTWLFNQQSQRLLSLSLSLSLSHTHTSILLVDSNPILSPLTYLPFFSFVFSISLSLIPSFCIILQSLVVYDLIILCL